MLHPQPSLSSRLVHRTAMAVVLCVGTALSTAPATAQDTPPTESPPELGALEEGLQLMAAGKFSKAHKTFAQARVPGFESMPPLLVRLAELYRVSSVTNGRRGRFATRSLQEHLREEPQKNTVDPARNARLAVLEQAQQSPPTAEEYKALLTWTRTRNSASRVGTRGKSRFSRVAKSTTDCGRSWIWRSDILPETKSTGPSSPGLAQL